MGRGAEGGLKLNLQKQHLHNANKKTEYTAQHFDGFKFFTHERNT